MCRPGSSLFSFPGPRSPPLISHVIASLFCARPFRTPSFISPFLWCFLCFPFCLPLRRFYPAPLMLLYLSVASVNRRSCCRSPVGSLRRCRHLQTSPYRITVGLNQVIVKIRSILIPVGQSWLRPDPIRSLKVTTGQTRSYQGICRSRSFCQNSHYAANVSLVLLLFVPLA